MSALSEQIKQVFNDSKDFLCTMKRCFILLLVVGGISTLRVLPLWEDSYFQIRVR